VEDGIGIDEELTGGARDRAAARDSMFLLATLRGARSTAGVSLRVRNVSAGGLMGEIAGYFAEGDIVEVDLRNVGTVAAQVAWRRGDRIGLSFEREIDPIAVRKPVTVRPSAPRSTGFSHRPRF
jgi:hypothetical protein